MCLPVNVRYGDQDTSYLRESWLYHLAHRDQMKCCFFCFKADFLTLKETLETEEWEEEESESEPESSSVSSLEEGQENMLYDTSISTDLGIPTPEELELVPQPVFHELKPEEAVPLDLGPEDADCIHALPWKTYVYSSCPHQLMNPPLTWWDAFNVNLYLEQPVLLELTLTQPMTPLRARALLKAMNFALLLNIYNVDCFMIFMNVYWVIRNPDHRWHVLLDPRTVGVAQLQNVPHGPDLRRWGLSILESSELGFDLVPAEYCLREYGFKVHSYLPWHDSTPEDWSREPEERLIIVKFGK
ncbi:Testis expressed protein [Sigmodon hispidus]